MREMSQTGDDSIFACRTVSPRFRRRGVRRMQILNRHRFRTFPRVKMPIIEVNYFAQQAGSV